MRVIRYTDEMISEFKDKGYWTDETFYDFWAKNAREIPDREALVDSRHRVTWAQAKELVDQIAYHWVDMGLEKYERIIIQAPNEVNAFLARIAAERAGLVSLVVYAYMRQKELSYMIEKTGASAVVIPYTYRNFNYLEMYNELRKLSPRLEYIFLLDEDVPAGAPEGTYSLPQLMKDPVPNEKLTVLDDRRFDPFRDMAMLTSTTGTTGLPKLVEWNIAPRLCTAKGRVDIWNLNVEDTTAAIAPFAGGAAGTLTYFAAPLVGAKTVLLEEFTAESALELIQREKATCIGVVPTHLVRMLEQPVENYDISSLRFIRSAGGYLPPDVGQMAESTLGGVITSDLGTQDVGSVSGCRVDDPPELRRRTVGRPLAGNEVKLIDEDGNVVPPGEPGQLWFRGPNSPAGYFRDPETTATVFDSEGWATTGDIVKWDQGCLWIMGRAKDMIIRGGQNIYPAEIEGLLQEHPKVKIVAIVGYPDKELGERACAFVVTKPGTNFTFEEMISFLKEKQLASFKLPERLEVVESIPTVGDSGKIDKKVLKAELEKKM
ncbi:AMP-binding protein [Desulfoscipio gibsoniae]|uniref:Acyl-CoA synthetase (AMP-forming)/AMP-acid ligase II n=1 Tax=Desulfoscipio gibsoniae DSM 7213 TaxID=767817 RepID=R4KJN1_9FIRM|nr:AMP-binding protein [Desulfoscipio gibsoniae]AGL01817.1 acyl-CoA synthetase (AMP-forming)/AMP-acid ligase II [Desulfoscipio gibsoniae DSM 7213]